MARQVNIHEAKTHFSELIAAVERGEEIVIARRGKPVAVLAAPRAATALKGKREFGQWAGRIRVDPSFFEPKTHDELEELYPDLEALQDIALDRPQRNAG